MMVRNRKTIRISTELYDLLYRRSKNFNTKLSKESENLVKISEELSKKLGIDLAKVPVFDTKKVKLHTKKNVLVFGK